MSQEAVDEVLRLLDLEAIEVNIFRGSSPDEDRQRTFGGQVAGQALMAAVRTVEADGLSVRPKIKEDGLSARPCISGDAENAKPRRELAFAGAVRKIEEDGLGKRPCMSGGADNVFLAHRLASRLTGDAMSRCLWPREAGGWGRSDVCEVPWGPEGGARVRWAAGEHRRPAPGGEPVGV